MTAVRKTGESLAPITDTGYRLGLVAAHRGDDRAFELLSNALETALAQGDAERVALATAALAMTGQLRGNFRRFREHLPRLARVRDATTHWRTRDDELLALTGLLSCLLFVDQKDAYLDTCVARIMALLEQDLDVNLRFAAGRTVLFYTESTELRPLGQRVYALLRSSLGHADLTPHRLARWLLFWSRSARYAKRVQQADEALAQARALANQHGLNDVLFWLAWVDIDRSLSTRDIRAADRALAVAETLADPGRLADLKVVDFMISRVARLKGQGNRAVFHAARALKYCTEIEDPPVVHGAYMVNEAHARLAVDDFGTACDLMRRAAAMVPREFAIEVNDMVSLAEAYVALQAGEAGGAAMMAAAWAPVRQRQFYDVFEGTPEFGSKLCALALAHGIEVPFIRDYIKMRAIAPPADAPDAWPWPIQVRALGSFAVERDGELLLFEGKAQKKPIDLLKVLVALGGHGVAKQKLCEMLWPDAEQGAAASSLDVVISRLRKLLGDPDAIRIEEGKVGLNAERVWLDTWAFDRDVEALQGALQASSQASTIDTLGQRLLQRYRGPFLGSEDPQRWSLSARDRWQNRFRRSLADAGRFWEQCGEWAKAIALYERALEEDSLAEDLYRRLMRAHIAQGEAAEAARVYRRCRDMLSVQLGIPPSPDTEAVFKSIYNA